MADATPSVEIRQMVVGPIETNCYAVVSDGECMVVDPGDSGQAIAEALSGVHVSLVVATHGHHDHVGGVAALVAATGAPFAMSATDLQLSLDEADTRLFPPVPKPDRLLAAGDEVTVGSATFRVEECPGHTPGGIALVGEGVAFVGDTLFAGTAGRTDLVGGDMAALRRTLAHLAQVVPPDTTVLSGHGPSSTMAFELAHNPYLAS